MKITLIGMQTTYECNMEGEVVDFPVFTIYQNLHKVCEVEVEP